MKLHSLLFVAPIAAAWVIPTEEQQALLLEKTSPHQGGIEEFMQDARKSPTKEAMEMKDIMEDVLEATEEAWTNEIEQPTKTEYLDTKQWLSSWWQSMDLEPADGNHGGGHHGHHDHRKPNKTIYELIVESKYTTKLAALINEFDDLIELLNSTVAGNITLFAPTDRAFAKIPDDAPKPSKELLKNVLSYHISPEFYPAGRVLATQTIPTLLEGNGLSESPEETPQRLSTNIGFKGLTVNYYSRIVAVNIFGTNGVIHGVDSILIPPPKAAALIQFLPSEFSTLELGLIKTGLFESINNTENHLGGTLFAPSNFAFKKLGPRATGFLFSKFGLKYLKALLQYHVVPDQTLYSDAYYKPESEDAILVPKGLFHVDLPTLLEERHLSIDIFRYGRYINIKINGFSTVTTPNLIARDGVIHVVSNVLIPPKQVNGNLEEWKGEEISEEDLRERLEPYIEDSERSFSDL